ncbi:MAG TPA: PH domain-containing protein [Actinomycetota bacterium]|nr:PH domain-containing protein [Actinomycetota bacterium]
MRLPSKRLDPRLRLAWWLVGAMITLGVAVASFVTVTLLVLPHALAAGASAAVAVVAFVSPPLIWRRWRYEIRDRDLFVSHGYLFAVHKLVPFDRIQYVENRQGPLDRAFGLTKLLVYTAAGKSAEIPGLSVSEADSLREELSRVAGTMAV